jgi:hypothetical protein
VNRITDEQWDKLTENGKQVPCAEFQ